MDTAVETRVKAIIVKQLNVQEGDISPDKSFVEDLGADSLDVAELLMLMEEEFDIEIPEEKAEGLRTVGDAFAYISAQKPVE